MSKLLVWNPYLGQARWIEPSNSYSYHREEKYALGHGHDKEKKVLRFVSECDIDEFEMYSLKSNSWKVIDDITPDWKIPNRHNGVTLKGNTYWYAHEKLPLDYTGEVSRDHPDFLVSFDFTRERFGPRLPLPFHGMSGDVILSSVKEEQLAVLFYEDDYGASGSDVKIWITNKIEPNAVSWGNLFVSVFIEPDIGSPWFPFDASFFVDEEKKVAVVLVKKRGRNNAYMIGNNGDFKIVDLGQSIISDCFPLVCSYLPSSLQIT